MNDSISATVALTGRIALSAIFLISGIGKIVAPAATLAEIEGAGLPLPLVAYATAVAIEVIGGLLLVMGYRVAWVASIFAVFSLATALAFHTNVADPNQMTHLLKNVAIAGGMLHAALFGGGRFSLDARTRRM